MVHARLCGVLSQHYCPIIYGALLGYHTGVSDILSESKYGSGGAVSDAGIDLIISKEVVEELAA